MNREFFINILFLVAINLLIKPFYLFGIDRTVQNVVDPGAYGLYFALFNFTFLFQIVNDLGIQYFNNRNIAQHRQLLDKYFPHMLVLKGVLALVFLLLLAAFALLSGYRVALLPLIVLLGFNQVLSSLILFLRSNISGLGLYRTDSMISALDRLLLIFIGGALLLIPGVRRQFQIEWFVLAQSGSLTLTAVTAYGVVRRRLRSLRFRWRPAFWRLILRQSLPYAAVIFLMTVYTRIDGVMIERLSSNGLIEADLYASAYRLLDAANVIGFLFAGLLFPMFARMLNQPAAIGSLLRLSLPLLWAGAGALAASVFFFRTEIMVALYTSGGAYSGWILAWLMLSFVAITGSYIYGTLLSAQGALRAMNIISLGGVILNIGLNCWLIEHYQALGAAAATCLTQFGVFFAQLLTARRKMRLQVHPRMIFKILLFFSTLIILNYLLSQFVTGVWWWRFVAGMAAGLGMAFLLKMIDLRYLFALLRQKEEAWELE